MSNPERNVQKSAWYHRYAIWGIIVAAALAVIAFLILVPMRDTEVVETPVDEMGTTVTTDPETTIAD